MRKSKLNFGLYTILDFNTFVFIIKSWDVRYIGLMYELDEDYFLRSDELAKNYSDYISSSLQKTKPGKFK